MFDIIAIAELAYAGDPYALRALEERVRKDIPCGIGGTGEHTHRPSVIQERYITHLLGAVFPSSELEMTTAPVGLSGNEVRGIHTNHIFALICATQEQRVRAACYALGIKRKEDD